MEYYYEGKAQNTRRVDIKISGVWLNENIKIQSGRLILESDWAPSCNLESENQSYYKDKPPDVNKASVLRLNGSTGKLNKNNELTETKNDQLMETKSDELTEADWAIIIIINLIFIWEYSITTWIQLNWLIIKMLFQLLMFTHKLIIILFSFNISWVVNTALRLVVK